MLHTNNTKIYWRRIFLKGFYHIWAWWPSWSCDPDAVNKLSFPLPKEAPHKRRVGRGERIIDSYYCTKV